MRAGTAIDRRHSRQLFLRALGAALAISPLPGCSSEFSSCAETKTCPKHSSGGTDAGVADGALDASAAGGARGDAGAGGAPSIDGAHADTGTAQSLEASVDARIDAATQDASGPCSLVEGGIQSDPDHCGACTLACSSAGVKDRACVGGKCQPNCDDTHLDCDGNGENGCEADPATDADHCGACDVKCGTAGAIGTACVAGVCKPTCDGTHLHCDGKDISGCETAVDLDHCGACNVACSTSGATQTQCVQGVCKPTCDTKHADCDKNGSNGCEVDLTSPSDCGACKHSCFGGSCTNQKCDFVAVALNLNQPAALAVDDTYVHFMDGGTSGRVVRMSLSGAGVTPVVTGLMTPSDIVSDGKYLFFTSIGAPSSTGVRRIPSGAATVLSIADYDGGLVEEPGPLAVDGTWVYWADQNYAAILRAPKDGSAGPVQVSGLSSSSALNIAVDASNVYALLSDSWTWMQLDGTGGEHPGGSFTGSGSVWSSIAVDGTYVYYAGSWNGSTLTGQIARAPKAGGAGTNLGTFASSEVFVADSTSIYFSAPTGIYRVLKTNGSTPVLLAPPPSVGSVVKMVVHAEGGGNALYWVNPGTKGTNNGSILKVAL